MKHWCVTGYQENLMSVHTLGKSETQDICSYPNIMTDTPIEDTVNNYH